MNSIINIAKGRIKEAAGVLANDEGLRNDGKADQVAGRAEKAVEDAVRKIKGDAREDISEKRLSDMNGKLDIAKGRIKEAVGALVDDKELRNEGKADQADGKAKEVVEETIQAIKNTAQESIDKVKGTSL